MKATIKRWHDKWFVAAAGFTCVGTMHATFREACDTASYWTWKERHPDAHA